MTNAHIARQVESLRLDVSVLKSDMGDLVHNLVDEGKTGVGHATEKIGTAVHTRAVGFRERCKLAAVSLHLVVVKHPAISLAGAFTIGFLVSWFLIDRS